MAVQPYRELPQLILSYAGIRIHCRHFSWSSNLHCLFYHRLKDVSENTWNA